MNIPHCDRELSTCKLAEPMHGIIIA